VRPAAATVSSLPVVGPATLYVRHAARLARRDASLATLAAPLDDRLVFVLGSPRSGTTFLGGAVAGQPGFAELGEVLPLKAAIPRLARLETDEIAVRVRRILWLTRRLGGLGGLRGVEHTPETAFLGRALRVAFPRATLVHMVRDGRDVVCSLLERGWLGKGREDSDDAALAFGASPRFWVETERLEEFRRASEARRAAWAWRRYVEAGRRLGETAHELRYERLCTDPERVAVELAGLLGTAPAPLARDLAAASERSIGRYRRDLTPEQVADVESEAGALLAELGYG
jgi:hypothetical protein